MRKTPIICSFLMAFGVSALVVGCDNAPKTDTKPPASHAGATKAHSSGPGSTTGGGTEVPPAAGSAEKPK